MKKAHCAACFAALLLASLPAAAQEKTAVLSRMQNTPRVDGAMGSEEYSTTVDFPGMRIGLSLGSDALYVGMSAETEGWMGIGFSPKQTMDGAVIFIGFLTGKKAQLKIQKGTEWTHADFEGDLLNLFAMGTEGGRTVMELSLKTASLVAKGQKELGVITAFGESKDFTSYHESNRYSLSVKIE
jgi:hypothetical protein